MSGRPRSAQSNTGPWVPIIAVALSIIALALVALVVMLWLSRGQLAEMIEIARGLEDAASTLSSARVA